MFAHTYIEWNEHGRGLLGVDRAWLSTPMCVCDCKLEAGSVFLLFAVTYVHYVPTYVHVNVYTFQKLEEDWSFDSHQPQMIPDR